MTVTRKFPGANHEFAVEARRVFRNAFNRGEILKQPCARPGCQRTPTEAHHEDYAKPLDVVWLCRMHHHHRHQDNVRPWIKEEAA